MAATIVHFGEDTCFRLPVLRSAGYSVEACGSLDVLSSLLDLETEAVTLEAPAALVRQAATLTRRRCGASLVLFRNESGLIEADGFDLVIPALTAPEDWLREIAALLERSRAIRADSQALAQLSASLRDDSAAVREQTRMLRERCSTQRHIDLKDPWAIPGSKQRPASD